jgi:hypothetical protein
MHMLAVIAYGEDAFRLIDVAGRDVGWVRAKTIGFGGFGSENAAHAAAIDGARALVRCLKREFGVAHLELSDQPRARTIRDGDAEWVADGHVRVARLLRVENGGGCGQEFAIEFRLPPYANNAVAINAAQIAYGALSRELAGTSGPSALRAASSAAW